MAFADEMSKEFSPFYHLEHRPNIVLMHGAIDGRAALSFKRYMRKYPQTDSIILSSPGGNVQGALLIAEEVFENKISTLIMDDDVCASACAYVFFAGYRKILDGKLGVHQISGDKETTQADVQFYVSDILEALNRYDVPQKVVNKMLRTPPDEMYYFDNSTLSKSASFPTTVEAPVGQSFDNRAKKFTETVIQSGTLPKNKALEFASEIYADEVVYYGEVTSHSAVMADKTAYFNRWPIRRFRTNASSMKSTCENAICVVTGQYFWNVKRDYKELSGVAEFDYLLVMNSSIKIVSENGQVVKRAD